LFDPYKEILVEPFDRTLYRGIFLAVLGVFSFTLGAYVAAKLEGGTRWLGIAGVVAGVVLFILGFDSMLALFRHCCSLGDS
jgi:energy-converting hydrogenase Eha subunit E